MIRVEVTEEVLPGRGKIPAKQVVYAHLRNKDGTLPPHPRRMVVPLWEGEQPYKAGAHYTLAPESLYADKWDSFAVAPKLVVVSPVAGVQPK
jgi:hypothetical protein